MVCYYAEPTCYYYYELNTFGGAMGVRTILDFNGIRASLNAETLEVEVYVPKYNKFVPVLIATKSIIYFRPYDSGDEFMKETTDFYKEKENKK